MSWRSRADCVVAAAYLYVLAALGDQADEYEHPDAKVLTDAAAKADLSCPLHSNLGKSRSIRFSSLGANCPLILTTPLDEKAICPRTLS